jgi:hypothetical protein
VKEEGMKKILLSLVAAVIASAAGTVTAAADGGPSSAVSWGWDGVVAPGHQVRYVAIPSGRNTVVEAVRVLGGRVLRWTSIKGSFGVPTITVFGTAGGLSHDGRTLVLASQTGIPNAHAVTRFAVLNAHTLHLLPVITLHGSPIVTLHGSFSFDGLSPDASTLYLIQYTSAQDYNRYRVRAYDLLRRRLLPGAIVDKREPDELRVRAGRKTLAVVDMEKLEARKARS